MTDNDILYVMSALLGSTSIFAPTAYDLQANALQRKVNLMTNLRTNGDDRATRAARRSQHWGQWATQVTNCGAARTGGIHWVLSSTYFGDQPLAAIWEPLSSDNLSKDVVGAFQEVCGPDGVTPYIMEHQTDGWSCGYISVWWALYQHSITKTGGQPMESPPRPPVGWDRIVWLMLEARQAGIGALDLAVYPFLTRVWNDHTFEEQFVQQVQDHITAAILEAE